MTSVLLSPFTLGNLSLPNRVVMAPMTRCRADANRAPHALTATYYAQRASAGLIISEATQISTQAIGYPGTPGIHTPEQVAGWKLVTKAVHQQGGRIFLQLWHCGRISHSSFHEGAPSVAPSAIAAKGQGATTSGYQPFEVPHALTLKEIGAIVQDYARATENALAAGFDGVEIHGANGYLIDQFTRDGSNTRSDEYGGSIENRLRFALEVTDSVLKVAGAQRVGYRISPSGTFNDMSDSNPEATFSALASALNQRKIAYLHVVAPEPGVKGVPVSFFREYFKGPLMGCLQLTQAVAEKAIQSGEYDLAAFGQPYIANPDLVERFKKGAELNTPNPKSYYGGGVEGYTDYAPLGGSGR